MSGNSAEKYRSSDTGKEWFADWFDSPYYHLLYRNRDDREAHHFIDRLNTRFKFKKTDRVLDLACGRGRHAVFLADKGPSVTGIDLSENSIAYARKFERENLKFFVHDMRFPFAEGQFEYVLNLFTGFGYFDDAEEDLLVLVACRDALVTEGRFIIDFMNVKKTIQKLVETEVKEVDGIIFNITRSLENGFIVKKIGFEDQGRAYCFYEKVRNIDRDTFLSYFKRSGFTPEHEFGNYNLDPFNESRSDRLIFVLKKS